MNNFKAIIFDMDGLLLDSEKISFDTFNETLKLFNLEKENKLFYQMIGKDEKSWKNLLKENLSGKTDPNKFAKVWSDLYKKETTSKPIPIKDGAVALLNHLKDLKLITAIATSTKTNTAKEKLKNARLLEYFQLVIGGDQVKKGKPNPDIYLHVADKLSVNPQQCLALEDSENGVKSAISANMRVIQIPDMVQPSNELKQLGHTVLASLEDVICYDFSSFPSVLGGNVYESYN